MNGLSEKLSNQYSSQFEFKNEKVYFKGKFETEYKELCILLTHSFWHDFVHREGGGGWGEVII